MLVGGLAGIEPASAQPAGRDWAGWMQQRAQAHRASQRDHRDLEANGFRYVGTDGHSPYVYYVYRSADGREYHCAQGAWKTGPCFPNRRRDVRVLPGHVRIVDLKRAGFGYQGLRQGPRGIEHVYANARTGSVYACPNEGQASCRAVGQDSSARRAQARPRSVLD
jgi:hypothetical protein